ncbi:MAG: translation initiation factor IF-3 [Candidatus Lariskella arthropodorum]|uniref:translation initiation factor IF-3 n=1 Tax=Candidatus Lariskella endosymbiont of Epinotia ramella TaxID=3066224 RepID=UPI0030CD00DF
MRVNEQIKADEVRLIDENGDMVGVIAPREALNIARQRGLDLVEISPNASPPVCRLINYGKYRYEQQKKFHEAKKHQKVVLVKELKLRPNIDIGDYAVKIRSAQKFIKEGNKVKISLMFKGREITHQEVGFSLMQRFQNDVDEFAKIESTPKMEGKQIYMIIVPK